MKLQINKPDGNGQAFSLEKSSAWLKSNLFKNECIVSLKSHPSRIKHTTPNKKQIRRKDNNVTVDDIMYMKNILYYFFL